MEHISEILKKEKTQTPEERRTSPARSITDYLKAFKNRAGRDYIIDSENEKVINSMLEYFSHGPEFENKGGDLKKGILLMGNVGSGKTMLFKVMWELQFRTFGLKTCREVSREYAVGGFKDIEKYGRKSVKFGTNQQIQKYEYCFDDLGAEGNQKFYGNECNVMAEIIQDRYEHFVRYGLVTHFTTNLTPEEIEKNYGDRVISRLNEMCNFIYLGTGNSTDRRK